ncbi:MAG: RNase P subunit p30 family protein [Halobacteriota archaeon]|nr:RNase P subunit p30 family protein [Halobacteriota archaeon]
MKNKFFDLNVHSQPENSSSQAELCEVSKRYGYSGIAFTNHSDFFGGRMEMNVWNFEVYNGVEIVSSVSKLKDEIRRFRPKVTVLSVHGGDERINRMAVEDRRVDILCHPEEVDGPGLNHVLARSATKNGVAIEFNIGEIIHNRGRSRSRILSFMAKNLKLARKYDVPMVLTSSANSIYDLRAPREMMALASLFGMTGEEALIALSLTPQQIIRDNMSRLPNGVEVVGSH